MNFSKRKFDKNKFHKVHRHLSKYLRLFEFCLQLIYSSVWKKTFFDTQTFLLPLLSLQDSPHRFLTLFMEKMIGGLIFSGADLRT